jgi:tRNA(Ile)-lysidine synthase
MMDSSLRMTRRRKSSALWSAQATHVAELLPLTRLHPAVLAWAARRRRTEVWSVAFSGGADSLALLLVLWAHWPERRDRLVALHFNHRLRGRESTADEKFCRRACAALGIRLRVGRWHGTHRGASEAEARAVRHGFFVKEMKRRKSCALWLAHQQDDIAESMLMRLARGSGLGGLAAPRPMQLTGDGRTRLRPLLTFKKAELLAALRQAGVAWREDSSNARGAHFRNRIRHGVLRGWVKAAGRDALAGAALSRERLEEDEQALDLWAEVVAPLDRAGRLDLETLTGMPRAITRRALHRWLLAVKQPTDLSRQGFELLLAAVEQGKPTRFSLGRNGFAVIKQGRLVLVKG